MKYRCLIVVLATVRFLAGCATSPAAIDEKVRLQDGRNIAIRCAGTGAPTVILDAGWGGGQSAWNSVFPVVAAETRVCAYDRAGTGGSDPGPLPRDGRAIARDLARVLHGAKVDGPYVLVGHSIGALYIREFANRFPRKVTGMVLVDGTVEYQQRRFEAVLGPGAGSIEPIIVQARACMDALAGQHATPPPPRCVRPAPAVARWQNQLSELEQLGGRTSDQIAHGRQSYGDMPLIVLVAANTYGGEGARLWFRLHREVAQRSRRGEVRLVEGSGHLMMNDAPEAIVRAIHQTIADSRGRGHPSGPNDEAVLDRPGKVDR